PFRWMTREQAETLDEERRIGLRAELEELVDSFTGWTNSNWVMHGDNQRAILDAFFSTVHPQQSLVFFYAKHSPLSDDPRRLLVGAAVVTGVTPTGAYRSRGGEPFPAQMWETTITHSLRPDQKAGFLLPYQKLLAARDARGVDIDDALAFAPEGGWEARRILGDAAGPLGFDWLEAQLTRVWKLRGPCPGLPSALAAFGVPQAVPFTTIDRGCFPDRSSPPSTRCRNRARWTTRSTPAGCGPWSSRSWRRRR